MNKTYENIKNAIENLHNADDVHDRGINILDAIEQEFYGTDEETELRKLYREKVEEISVNNCFGLTMNIEADKEADDFFKAIDNDEPEKASLIARKDEKWLAKAEDITPYEEYYKQETDEELKKNLLEYSKLVARQVEQMVESYKEMRPGDDGWFFIGDVDDYYAEHVDDAERLGILEEFKKPFDDIWPLEHMTYDEFQIYLANYKPNK